MPVKPPADILRAAADVALRFRLDGQTFPATVDRTADPWGVRDTPGPVHRLAALIRWRAPRLSPGGVAFVLRAVARGMEERDRRRRQVARQRATRPAIGGTQPGCFPRLA